MKHKLALILISLVLIAGLPACKEAPKTSALPVAEMLDLDGNKVSLASFAGKPVIVNFWATWCGPCRLEIPMLNDLQKKYSDKGLVIIGISTDEEGASIVKEFNKEIPIHYHNYLSTPDVEAKFGQMFGLPTTYFYDRNGSLIDQPLVGLQGHDYWEKRIQQMLKQ